MAEWYWDFCERDDFIFNSFRNFKPVKRFQNRSDVLEFWSLDNSSSKRILFVLHTIYLIFWNIQGSPKTLAHFVLYALTDFDRFSNLFHCLNQENICNNTTTNDPITPKVGRHTTLWNVVMKQRLKSKTTSKQPILRVCRPAERQTHSTFDVKTAGCDSYFR